MKNNVKDERIKKGLTQIQLAEIVNVSRQTIISIETGRYVPSVLLALKIATALGTKTDGLFLLEDND